MLAGRFEEIDGAEGVDFKIENRNVAGFVVGRLRGAVNDEIEAARAEAASGERWRPHSAACA